MTKFLISQNAPERQELDRPQGNHPLTRRAVDQIWRTADPRARRIAIARLRRDTCEQFRLDLEAIARLENEGGRTVPAHSDWNPKHL